MANKQDNSSKEKQLLVLKETFQEKEDDLFIYETKWQRFVRLNGVNIAMISTFTGLFIGIPIIFWFSSNIMINVGTMFILLFVCGSLSLIQWRSVRHHIDMHYHQFAMYSFTGFGIWVMNILLFLNMMISIGHHSETYSMDTVLINEKNMYVRIGNSETSTLAKNLSSFLGSHFTTIPEANELTITFNKGLIGFDVIAKCEFH